MVKCPVCDSKVDKLKPLYQKEHVEEKIKTLSKKIIILKKKQLELEDSIQDIDLQT